MGAGALPGCTAGQVRAFIIAGIILVCLVAAAGFARRTIIRGLSFGQYQANRVAKGINCSMNLGTQPAMGSALGLFCLLFF